MYIHHTMTKKLKLTKELIIRLIQAKRVRLKHHAYVRAQERGIDFRDIRRTMIEGIIIEHYPRAKPHPKCLLRKSLTVKKPLYVSVAYNENTDRLFIITAHWHDPRKWNKDGTRKG